MCFDHAYDTKAGFFYNQLIDFIVTSFPYPQIYTLKFIFIHNKTIL